ncbi:TPA: sce7725 family protein [Bacillus cereus]|nr:sce7725 family protein [Bacillus cereus]HDR8266540.1 sce7725 family protein [Bacillus cereus]HDR8272514.1 sce7725 family protein [Bacillus cereus]HDR8277858.1 sce7725 family protein [Bacillus cereus]HDR8283170.1 sce7725 family protein [Bacillus cereus]
MYFPIIRGRQYDLLALRELQTRELLSDRVIPIIEPIKLSSTLLSTVKAFEDNNRELIIISNPKVGSFTGELALPSMYTQFTEMVLSNSVIIGHHLNRNSMSEIADLQQEFDVELGDLAIIHSERNLVRSYREIFNDVAARFNVIPSDNSFRRQLSGQELVGLDDKFNKLPRNVDYLEQENEFFSEEHRFFRDEGYIGFSDFSVVGEEYNEGGFAPYAVAIHIVYPNAEDALEIMHFVSDSNDDTSDPAGKFSEALEKLIQWYQSFTPDERMNTFAMQCFMQHHREGTYPGLPTLKKLSIMHHLELIGRLLD